MQSIQVKYLPATNTQPARLKATCEGGSIIEARNNLETSEQALNLAFKLSNKLNWNVKEFAQGSFKNCDYFNIIKIISKEHMNKENQITIKNFESIGDKKVIHFLLINQDYNKAVKIANKLGGRKFHNKKYGGGIAFDWNANLFSICKSLNEIIKSN
jgi:hypothetical protein